MKYEGKWFPIYISNLLIRHENGKLTIHMYRVSKKTSPTERGRPRLKETQRILGRKPWWDGGLLQDHGGTAGQESNQVQTKIGGWRAPGKKRKGTSLYLILLSTQIPILNCVPLRRITCKLQQSLDTSAANQSEQSESRDDSEGKAERSQRYATQYQLEHSIFWQRTWTKARLKDLVHNVLFFNLRIHSNLPQKPLMLSWSLSFLF